MGIVIFILFYTHTAKTKRKKTLYEYYIHKKTVIFSTFIAVRMVEENHLPIYYNLENNTNCIENLMESLYYNKLGVLSIQ